MKSVAVLCGGLIALGVLSTPAPAMAQTQGCGAAGLTTGAYTLEFEGITRQFNVYVPSTYSADEPAPLVAIFHGWGSNEDAYTSRRVVTAQADRRGYVLVAPRGLGSGAPDFGNTSFTFGGSALGFDGDGVNPDVPGDTDLICDPRTTPDYAYPSCEGLGGTECGWTHCQSDDVAFAVALVETVKQGLCIDEARVFATGISNGGMFTWELAQNPISASTFRAIAPVIGLPHRGFLTPPATGDDLPALLITGTADTTVPPGAWEDDSFTTTTDGESFYYTGATAITRRWAEAHGCDTVAPAAPFKARVPAADCRTYCAGDRGLPRVLDCRADMGHSAGLPWSWKLTLDFFDGHS